MELRWQNKIPMNSKVVVIPTADVNQDHTQRAIDCFIHQHFDILCVQDSGKDFVFSKSMNAGIDEVLKNQNYKIIGLSNDDIYDFTYKSSKLLAHKMETSNIVYFRGRDQKRNGFTSSRLHYIINVTLIQKAPFHAVRNLKYFADRGKERKFIIPMPSFIEDRCIQPLAFFKREILENYKFDENIVNGVEDDDLLYRLIANKHIIFEFGGYISHITGATFRKIVNTDSDNYYGRINHLRDNAVYFSNKHIMDKMDRSPLKPYKVIYWNLRKRIKARR